MPTIAQLLADAAEHFAAHSASPRLDAELLLARALDRPRSHLLAWPEREPEPAQQRAFAVLAARREAGEPIAHILGEREFWSLPLKVSPDTLIPRPETETLVEAALDLIPPQASWRLADLGTGSGAIALALAAERPRCRILATDRSAAALAVARENAAALGYANVEFREGSWFEPLAGGRFELIASNPPYIAATDPHLSRGDVRFEPATALAAGPDGLDDLRSLITGAPAHLAAGGWLLLEHGYDQGTAVAQLLRAAGFEAVACRADAGGRERVSLGRRPTP